MLGFKAFLISLSKKLLLFMVCTILSWQPCKRKMKRVTQVPAWPPTTKHPDHVWTQFLSAFIKSKKLPSGILSVSLTASITGEMLPIRCHQSCVLCIWTVECFPSFLSGILAVSLTASLPGDTLPSKLPRTRFSSHPGSFSITFSDGHRRAEKWQTLPF